MQVQLAELIDNLDKQFWEADLYAVLEEMREELHAHMDITEDLTNKARGSNKCFLTAANGEEARTHALMHSVISPPIPICLSRHLGMYDNVFFLGLGSFFPVAYNIVC